MLGKALRTIEAVVLWCLLLYSQAVPDVFRYGAAFHSQSYKTVFFHFAFWLFMKHAFKPVLLLVLIECRRELKEILTHYSTAYGMVDM